MITFVKTSKVYTELWPIISRKLDCASSKKWASSSSKWDRILNDIAGPLNPQVQSEFNLTRSLQSAMKEKDLKESLSSQGPITSHFSTILSGLDTVGGHHHLEMLIANKNFNQVERYLRTLKTEKELKEVFDFYNAHGKLNSRLAILILTDKKCNFVKEMATATSNIRHVGWSKQQYHKFRILLGVKCCRLKQYNLGKSIIELYLSNWTSLSMDNEMTPGSIRCLHTGASLLGLNEQMIEALDVRLDARLAHPMAYPLGQTLNTTLNRTLDEPMDKLNEPIVGEEKYLQRLYIPLLHSAFIRRQYHVASRIVTTFLHNRIQSKGLNSDSFKPIQKMDGYYVYMTCLSFILEDPTVLAANKTCVAILKELAYSDLDFSITDDVIRASMRLLTLGDSLGGAPTKLVRLILQQYVHSNLEVSHDKVSIKLLKQKLSSAQLDGTLKPTNFSDDLDIATE